VGTEVIAVVLVLLHSPSGRDILINPAAVTSMQAAIEGKKNERIAEEVRCLINTSDGKFVSVVEPCERVRELFRQSEQQP
jgi:hypothetical protein